MGSTKKRTQNNANDSKRSEAARMTIIVAIIGLIGTLGAAYLNYLGTRQPVPPTAAVPIPSTTANQVNSITETVTSLSTGSVPTETASATGTPIISLTPTSSPTLTVEDQLIQLIDIYYTCLNAASPDDLSTYTTCWNLLSDRPGEAQAKLNTANNGYGFDTLVQLWRNHKATYSLYLCTKSSTKVVDAKYDLYLRSDLSTSTGTYFKEYSFALDNKGWRIKSETSATKIPSYCESQPRIEKSTVAP